jgi:hypothetical protein
MAGPVWWGHPQRGGPPLAAARSSARQPSKADHLAFAVCRRSSEIDLISPFGIMGNGENQGNQSDQQNDKNDGDVMHIILIRLYFLPYHLFTKPRGKSCKKKCQIFGKGARTGLILNLAFEPLSVFYHQPPSALSPNPPAKKSDLRRRRGDETHYEFPVSQSLLTSTATRIVAFAFPHLRLSVDLRLNFPPPLSRISYISRFKLPAAIFKLTQVVRNRRITTSSSALFLAIMLAGKMPRQKTFG